ncbi:hypothetical protein VTO73DRAFT_6047 [Trametes versicolor]
MQSSSGESGVRSSLQSPWESLKNVRQSVNWPARAGPARGGEGCVCKASEQDRLAIEAYIVRGENYTT